MDGIDVMDVMNEMDTMEAIEGAGILLPGTMRFREAERAHREHPVRGNGLSPPASSSN